LTLVLLVIHVVARICG